MLYNKTGCCRQVCTPVEIFLTFVLINMLNFASLAQVYQPLSILSPPYETYYNIKVFPKANDKITFSLPHPFVDFKDSILDRKSTYQSLASFPKVQDSLLSECIKFAMSSLNFEQKFCNHRKGAEIWYGVTKGSIPTLAGIYYTNKLDSTYMYVFTGFDLTAFDRKSKTDISKLICERIIKILEIHLKWK